MGKCVVVRGLGWWGGEVCGSGVGKCVVVGWGSGGGVGKRVVVGWGNVWWWGGEVCGGVGWGNVWWSGVRGEYLTLYTRVFEAVKVTVSA